MLTFWTKGGFPGFISKGRNEFARKELGSGNRKKVAARSVLGFAQEGNFLKM